MTFLYLSANTMGSGDDTLGQKLLLSFLQKLAESDEKVDVIGCANSGILLTTAGSDALPALEKLADKGARIATCGTCLDHHGMRDKLAIGQVGTMEQTVAIMTLADKVIHPC